MVVLFNDWPIVCESTLFNLFTNTKYSQSYKKYHNLSTGLLAYINKNSLATEPNICQKNCLSNLTACFVIQFATYEKLT